MNYLFIHVSVTAVRVGTWLFILRVVRLLENRWEFECFVRHLFTTLNILKYPRFLSKIIKTNSFLVCSFCFFVIFAVLAFLCHYCSSLHKTEYRELCHAILTMNRRRLAFEFCLLFQSNMRDNFTRGNPQELKHQISSQLRPVVFVFELQKRRPGLRS